MLADLRDCYRILDLEPSATLEEVKRSYRELVKVWHPDRFGNDLTLQKKAQEKLKQINLAYERICKEERVEPRRAPGPTGANSASGEPRKKTSDSGGASSSRGDSQQKTPGQPPPHEAKSSASESKRGEGASRAAGPPRWAYAATGVGFLVLSIWLAPSVWNDFSKYEAGEGIVTTKRTFALYKLLGKPGLIAFFLLFGLSMGYVGLCHARALLSGGREVQLNLKKGHLVAAVIILGFFVLIGERPERRNVPTAVTYVQPNRTSQPPQAPVVEPNRNLRQPLPFERISQPYPEAVKKQPELEITSPQPSRPPKNTHPAYDGPEGMPSVAPKETAPAKPQVPPATILSAPEASVANLPLGQGQQEPPVPSGISRASEGGRVEMALIAKTPAQYSLGFSPSLVPDQELKAKIGTGTQTKSDNVEWLGRNREMSVNF